MNLSVEFLGGPVDRWHRWTVVADPRDAFDLAHMLLIEKYAYGVAVRETADDAAPHWQVPG